MDLSTSYLGFSLPHPFMPGASPLVDDLDTVRQLEDAGAAAIVMRSLFEEQITGEQVGRIHGMEEHAESFAEARSYFPDPEQFALGPEEYLDQVRQVKRAVGVPVIASLNGITEGGWLDYAGLIAEAGADALELNIYELPTDPALAGADIEARTVALVQAIKGRTSLPLAVKLSPFYSSLAHLAGRLAEAGAGALVLFNRFYQPDIDVEELEVARTLQLSTSSELLLRWLAILHGRVGADLAATGGVHSALDGVKAIMAGASAVQMVSALLQRGPEHLKTLRDEVAVWLEEHEYESLAQMRGSMSLEHSPDPSAFERANYMHVLQSWTV